MRHETVRAAHPRLLLASVIGLVLCVGHAPPAGRVTTPFARIVERLSEPGGYFDTDNLISNEKSYLHVITALEEAGIGGGAYVGVGPDQNFSYIAATRPAIAFIIDIRRDNLLLHLLFKALFDVAPTRLEYLCLLTGRPVPDRDQTWHAADIEALVAFIDSTSTTPAAIAAAHARVATALGRIGVPLSPDSVETIDRFHRAFITGGLSLKFQSAGRSPRSYYPTYRELLLERDRAGHHANYLASEQRFQVVRSLQQRDLVIPVVGDLGGTHALAAIGRVMADRGLTLSAFYTSNVEFYLFRDGRFGRFVDNLSRLPRTDRSVIIRAVFFETPFLPESMPGYPSTSLVRPVTELIDGFAGGRYRSARDLASGAIRLPHVP